MKPFLLSILVLTLCAGTCARAGDLAIRVDDVRSGKGHIMVALYDSAAGFLKHSVKVAAVPAVPTVDGAVNVVIADVPPGDYAFALYHDANGNGQMDHNGMGMPTEDFAFSNNVLGTMGPPAFEQARFAVPAAGATVTVSLR